jgi:hypothetical protein
MKTTRLLAGTASLLFLFTSVSLSAAAANGPKAKLMAKYDKNGNGVIDGDEIEAVRKDFAAEPDGDLKRFDTNKDGKLDDTEIAAMKPPGGKNKDGEKKSKGKAKDAGTTKDSEKPKDAEKSATPDGK